MDKKLYKQVNAQVTKELFSAYLYLSMASYFEEKGLAGMAGWMKVQAKEEVEHGMKIFGYLNDRGQRVVLDAFDKPESEFKSVQDVFAQALAHEKKVTASIHNIYGMALDAQDHATAVFFEWFVDEQVEEEKNVSDILTKLGFIKENPMGILMLDKELGARIKE